MITTKWLTPPGIINFENSTPTSNLEHSDHTSYEFSEWTSPYRSLYHKDIRRSALDIVWLVAVEIELRNLDQTHAYLDNIHTIRSDPRNEFPCNLLL